MNMNTSIYWLIHYRFVWSAHVFVQVGFDTYDFHAARSPAERLQKWNLNRLEMKATEYCEIFMGLVPSTWRRHRLWPGIFIEIPLETWNTYDANFFQHSLNKFVIFRFGYLPNINIDIPIQYLITPGVSFNIYLFILYF